MQFVVKGWRWRLRGCTLGLRGGWLRVEVRLRRRRWRSVVQIKGVEVEVEGSSLRLRGCSLGLRGEG